MNPTDIFSMLEQLQHSAQTGKNYAKDIHNINRFQDILDKIEALYTYVPHFGDIQLVPLTDVGYVTPKVGVNAIIENKKGEILLEKRTDDKAWCVIGGWCEAGLSPEENIIKEVKEETGFDAKINRMIRIFSRVANEKYPYSSYHILYHCSVTGGQLKKSYESEDVAFLAFDEVKEWHYDHRDWVEFYLENIKI